MTDRAASRRPGDRRRAYLLGPSYGTDAERLARFLPAFDALTVAGYDVTAAGFADPTVRESADHLLSVVEGDYDGLITADVVVTLPGSDALWEIPVAEALGLPVVAFADILAERLAA